MRDQGRVRSEIRDYLVESAKRIEDELRYACIFGSAAYEIPSESDVDIAFVTSEPLSPSLRSQLSIDYMEFHQKFNFSPDKKFPGEYVSCEELWDAIAGKGFHYEDGVQIEEIHRNEWTTYNSYRHHLTVVAGPTDFVYGSPQKLRRDKFASLRTLVKVLLIHREVLTFTRSDLVDWAIAGGKSYLGFQDVEPVRSYLTEHFRLVLQEMVYQGFLTYDSRRYSITDPTPLEALESRIQAFQAAADH